MADSRELPESTNPPPGMVSEGGIDESTGAFATALAGAVVGASAGPIGLAAGAVIGAAIGAAAARGPEHPDYPEHWAQERARLHKHPWRG